SSSDWFATGRPVRCSTPQHLRRIWRRHIGRWWERRRGRAVVNSFYDRMTPQQRAEFNEGIAQAERGQVRAAEEVFDRLAKCLGFSADHSPRHGLRLARRV